MKVMRSFKLNNSGFTLIEMLVAASVSSVILLMIYTAYTSILRTVNYGTVVASYYEELNFALKKIDKDISNLYWRSDGKAGLICSVRDNSSLMSFVTYDYKDHRIINNPSEEFPVIDVYRVSYFLKPDDTGRYYDLVRRSENGYSDLPDESGREETLLNKVIDYKVFFTLRGDWTDRWDTRENKRLPSGIKTELTLENISGQQEKYEILSIPDTLNE